MLADTSNTLKFLEELHSSIQLIKPPHLVIGLSASTDSWKTAPTEQQLKIRFEAIATAQLHKVAIFGGNYDFIEQYRPLLQSFLMKSDDGGGSASRRVFD